MSGRSVETDGQLEVCLSYRDGRRGSRKYVPLIVMDGESAEGKYVRLIGRQTGEATMSGISVWTELQVVFAVATLGESMSGISVSRPGD
jgi:hypothetical protein